ncbi:MAG TPA: D-sedoheptulose 7-phosphate isomerase [Persephonella sp.]|uniref:Phosphoheptose isomerase n=1 Tax=Persephonella marina (strain DSM 14350 / EX-H1) TaxID=123214 RepID=C0QSE5_PERMH|nr:MULTISPECIES: D-sedoheptulose 7-phosphate isomerase [Persephonella]ACO03881.1 phosphoheptose isomerase [Persephonella marina EX-H1]HCB69339.1 D-sedoheptulose 7-phosphate isomerase [Persephonella sp.]
MDQDSVINIFEESASLKKEFVYEYAEEILNFGILLAKRLKNGNKVLICGNGGSSADAQHFAAEIVGRFELERKGFPAIALTTDTSILTAVGNDYGFENIFSRQVEALGEKGDILIGISTSGNSENVVRAVLKAKEIGMFTAGFLGKDGGKLKDIVDFPFIVKHNSTARIQEVHLTLEHTLCKIVDLYLTGEIS